PGPGRRRPRPTSPPLLPPYLSENPCDSCRAPLPPPTEILRPMGPHRRPRRTTPHPTQGLPAPTHRYNSPSIRNVCLCIAPICLDNAPVRVAVALYPWPPTA